MTDKIPGLIFHKGYFPVMCTATATGVGDAPCCLASGILLTPEELTTLSKSRIPCQRCMMVELDTPYIDAIGASVSRFSSHDIRGKKMKRRVQHYGYRYDYTHKCIQRDQCFDYNSLSTLQNLRVLFGGTFGIKTPPNQAIVNEYLKKQNIDAHTDFKKFGPVVITISLLQPTFYVMDTGKDTPAVNFQVDPGDLVVLTGDSRSVWRHGTTDGNGGDYRRVSITLRYVDDAGVC
jgi:alkylated DNA repair dioxygenase AlkB